MGPAGPPAPNEIKCLRKSGPDKKAKGSQCSTTVRVPLKRSPAPSAKGNRAKTHRQAEAQKNYRTSSEKSTELKAVAWFYAYDGQLCTGLVRDFGKTVEAVDLNGRSLGFFDTRSQALQALGGAR